jgi:hypothetical protein
MPNIQDCRKAVAPGTPIGWQAVAIAASAGQTRQACFVDGIGTPCRTAAEARGHL